MKFSEIKYALIALSVIVLVLFIAIQPSVKYVYKYNYSESSYVIVKVKHDRVMDSVMVNADVLAFFQHASDKDNVFKNLKNNKLNKHNL